MQAYNLKFNISANLKQQQGWCFGLPPIKSEQWPLDPCSGYPLMHGFTLLLPEDYRIHGDDVVALSFFATAPDHNDGGPCVIEGMEKAVLSNEPPTEISLLPFWQHMQTCHPRRHYMEDILGCYYAVVLLTQDEFDAQPCPVPPILNQRSCLLDDTILRPDWVDKGAALTLWESVFSVHLSKPAEDYFVYRELGGIPKEGVEVRIPVECVPNGSDPNAGKRPVESWNDSEDEYRQPYGEKDGNYEAEAWLDTIAPNHIGGTMRPVQGIPEFSSPYFIEFEEYFGGYNFGGGNAQLDIKQFKFDWAC